jgi:hypothetical protein
MKSMWLILALLVFATPAMAQNAPCEDVRTEFTPGVTILTKHCTNPKYDLTMIYKGVTHGQDDQGHPWTMQTWSFVPTDRQDPDDPEVHEIHMMKPDDSGKIDIDASISMEKLKTKLADVPNLRFIKERRDDTGTLVYKTLYYTLPGGDRVKQADGTYATTAPRGTVNRALVNECTDTFFYFFTYNYWSWDEGESWMDTFQVQRCK